MANGVEPKSFPGQVFNFKLGSFATKRLQYTVPLQPLLKLKKLGHDFVLKHEFSNEQQDSQKG